MMGDVLLTEDLGTLSSLWLSSHCPYLDWPKGVLVMSAVYLSQWEHNNRTLVMTKMAELRPI